MRQRYIEIEREGGTNNREWRTFRFFGEEEYVDF